LQIKIYHRSSGRDLSWKKHTWNRSGYGRLSVKQLCKRGNQ